MKSETLKDRCRINTNIDSDTFVGIQATGNDIRVNFPLGFRVSNDERELRREILLLLDVLSKNTEKKDSSIDMNRERGVEALPIHAYLFIISDYYSRGYYKETEVINKVRKNGKVNWSKTIKTQRAYVDGGNAYYLDFVTKKTNFSENELITLIHEYCVYESFEKIGWLFTSHIPSKPTIKPQKRLFKSVVNAKLRETYKDLNRQLFKHLLTVIDTLGDDESITKDYKYGTYRFEYVWESMIDKAYGTGNKSDFFPLSKWVINGVEYENSYLRPDAIMLSNGSVYVLDAKYYKYGWTKAPSHLPDSESVNKQITYGEFIAKNPRFRKEDGQNPDVYNAFIMPYDSYGKTFCTETELHHIGNAISDWKSKNDDNHYEKVVGVLLDVKSIMRDYSKRDKRIEELATLIENAVKNPQ